MPGRSGDYDAGGMVWGSMIGKKLFGGSGLPPGRASLPAALLGLGARLRALVSGRRRPDELYFCRAGLHDSVPSTVTISRYLLSDDERIQPQRSRSSQRTHRDFL